MGFLLNDQWITVYIEVLSGLLIFVVGISALIFQIALPAYLRTLMGRRRLQSYTVGIMLLYVLMMVGLIWFTHPDENGLLSQAETWIVNIAMSITLLLTVVYALHNLRQINSTRYIESLREESEVDLRRDGVFDDTLDTLIDIGRQSGAGFEKKRVIDALADLTDYVLGDIGLNEAEQQADKERSESRLGSRLRRGFHRSYRHYDGTNLKPIIRSFEEILVGGSVEGSRDNFRDTASLLKTIITRLRVSHEYADCADMAEAVRVSGMLAIASLTRFSSATQKEFIEAIRAAETTDRRTYLLANKALREIGVAALGCGQFQIAVSALDALLSWDGDPLYGDEGAELLGLIAHMRIANAGGSQYADQVVGLYADSFMPSFDDCLREAMEYHYESGNFDTYECLRQMHTLRV